MKRIISNDTIVSAYVPQIIKYKYATQSHILTYESIC